MGMKSLRCPSCGANLEMDDSKEYGFCSYCGTKVQINDRINVNVVHTQGKESAESLLQKAQHCLNTATIENDNVSEALSYGQMAIENSSLEKQQAVSDQLARMYIDCMTRLGQEMVATIKTYNNTDRNSIAIRQTHNVLKTMIVAPNYFQKCSAGTIGELENTSVRICRSLTGWAKSAAKAYNQNQANCANIQRIANGLRSNVNNSNPEGVKPKKPWFKKWWIWVIIGVAILLLISIFAGNGDKNPKQESGSKQQNEAQINNDENKDHPIEEEKQTEEVTQPTTEDISQIQTVYELGNGHYTAGIDLPIGRCNVYAVSGGGNVSSSNMFSGGMNEMFGIDDGEGWYTESFTGLKMDKNVVLDVSGGVIIRLEYTNISKGYSGRTYHEEEGFDLGAGNYVAGEDFPAGTYRITASYGTGNLSSSNIFDGGVNEMFGIDDGYGWYSDRIENVELPKGEELEVSGGLGVRMVPATPNN